MATISFNDLISSLDFPLSFAGAKEREISIPEFLNCVHAAIGKKTLVGAKFTPEQVVAELKRKGFKIPSYS